MGRDLDALNTFLDKRRGDFGFVLSHVILPEEELSVEVGYVDSVYSRTWELAKIEY